MATMVGADRAAFKRIKAPFSRWAALVIHAGQPGAGTQMKLARNMLTFSCYAAACEAEIGRRNRNRPQDLGQVVRHSDAL